MLDRLTTTITARRTAGWVALLGLLLAGLVQVLGATGTTAGPTSALPDGADSTIAAQWQSELPEQDGSTAVVLFTADQGQLPKGDLPRLAEAAGVPADRVVPSKDGTAAIAVLPIEATSSSGNATAITDLRDRLGERTPEGVTAQVTGPAGVQADLAAVFDGADFRLLGATATVVAILLIATYRSPILWLIPLGVIGLGDRTASVLATRTLDVVGLPWDESTTGILSVLVFGAGTNYALLLISRYRDELRHTPDGDSSARRAALAHALRQTAHSVLTSAATVVVGVLTLLLSLVPTTRSLGLASAVGIVVAAAFALVVLPAVLALFGRWIFWPRAPHHGEEALTETRTIWRRVGDRVATHPVIAVSLALALLTALGAGLTQVRLGLPTDEQFLSTPESIAASTRLAESFPAGSADPAVIVTRDDPAAIRQAAEGVEGIESVRPVAAEDGLTELQAVLSDPADSPEAEATVHSLRSALEGQAQTHVGGTTAQAIDESDASARDRLVVMPLILALILLALIGLLRCLVAPLVLVSATVLTSLASLGVSWWLFTGPLGFTALDSSAPLLAFLFLTALGVDYAIFLITRTLEEAPAHGTRTGVLRALAATGGVITSAGILLAAVFAVLGVLPLVVLAQIGTIVGIGVLLDTLLVRTIVVPAVVLALGDRFWWPRQVSPS